MTHEIPSPEPSDSPESSSGLHFPVLGLYVQGTYAGVEHNIHGEFRIQTHEYELRKKLSDICLRETNGQPMMQYGADNLVVPDTIENKKAVSKVLGPPTIDQAEAARVGQVVREEISMILAVAPRNPTIFIPYDPSMEPSGIPATEQ